MQAHVLKHWNPMVGADVHNALMPPFATPNPTLLHAVAAFLKLGPWGSLTGRSRTDVRTAAYGETMIRGTDIGPLIPHVSVPHYLLPVHTLVSSSKSEFGAASIRTPDGPVAVACLAYVNLNLNCWGPVYPPLPSGVVVSWSSHVTGFTWGDALAGVAMMVFDSAIQFALNRIFAGETALGRLLDRAFNRLSTSVLSRIIGRSSPELVRRMDDALVDKGGEMAWHWARAMGRSDFAQGISQAAVDSLLPTVAAQLLGSPMGYAYSGGGLGEADRVAGPDERSFTDSINDGIANLYDGKEWDEYP